MLVRIFSTGFIISGISLRLYKIIIIAQKYVLIRSTLLFVSKPVNFAIFAKVLSSQVGAFEGILYTVIWLNRFTSHFH